MRDLHATLTAALRHGARTARIAHYTPHLIEILYPDGSLTASYLAAVDIAPGTLGMPLHDRRAIAARQLGVEPGTMRRNHQRSLLWDLAMEIYQAYPASLPNDHPK